MGLIRLVIFVCVAFGAGVLYERSNARERCAQAGGTWANTLTGAGYCTGDSNG